MAPAKPNHVDPDFVRWELHRVWVVEATLKPGARHIYAKRTFYLDEDSWVALGADQYDANGKLYRSTLGNMAFSYDVQATPIESYMFYDFTSGGYSIVGCVGAYDGLRYTEPLPEIQWSPEALSGAGIR